MKNTEKPKIIVVLGQTATGKSNLAVDLARKFNGEIISADSRQVYKGLDIGTGKITKKEMQNVPHYLLDVISPKKIFSVAEYKKLAKEEINKILKKNKTPIICGGTGLYIQSITDDFIYPEVPPNKKLREKLSKLNAKKLFAMLKKLDPQRAKNIDAKNPHRLIRAIEIAMTLGKVPKIKKQEPKYQFLKIGTRFSDKITKERIYRRLISRIDDGLIKEVKKLHRKDLSYKRMLELGLEYKYLALFLQKKLSKEQMIEDLYKAIWQFAKRQNTWFKRDKEIIWINPSNKNDLNKIEKMTKEFLK